MATPKIESVPLSALRSDPANVRKHDERNILAIMESLRRWGQQRPIITDAEGTIHAGNGTYEAARRLGWKTIQRTVSDLNPNELRAYAIADNRTAELASWSSEVGSALSEITAALDGLDLDALCLSELAKAKGKTKLSPVAVDQPPRLAWVLIGVPLNHWPDVSPMAEAAAKIEGAIVETAANDGYEN